MQEVLGSTTLLYYAHAIDFTMLPALGTVATQQATPTVATLTATVFLTFSTIVPPILKPHSNIQPVTWSYMLKAMPPRQFQQCT